MIDARRLETAIEVRSLLEAGANVAMHAAPGVGKSHLGRNLLRDMGPDSAFSIDLSMFPSGIAALSELISLVEQRRGMRSTMGLAESIHGAWMRLTDLCLARQTPLVLILDEFDHVRQFPDSGEFLRHLRQLISSPRTTKCVALLLSRRPIATIEEEVRGISTLSGVCFPQYLRPMCVADVLGEPEEFGLDGLERDAMLSLIQWSGGLPALVKYAWLKLPTRVDSAQGDDIRLPTVETLLKYLSALGLVDAVTQLVLGPAIDVSAEDHRRLIALGFVNDIHAMAGSVAIADMDAFRDRLRAHSLDANPWGAFGAAERALREIVETILSSKQGIDWLATLLPKSPALRKAYDGVAERQVADDRRFGKRASWLAYTYPGELWAIVSERWSDFEEVFVRGDKRYWRERCEGLAALRAPLAHNRVELLDDERRMQVTSWSRDILNAWQTYQDGERSVDIDQQTERPRH